MMSSIVATDGVSNIFLLVPEPPEGLYTDVDHFPTSMWDFPTTRHSGMSTVIVSPLFLRS